MERLRVYKIKVFKNSSHLNERKKWKGLVCFNKYTCWFNKSLLIE